MAEILPRLAVDDHLAVSVGADVDDGDRVAGRELGAELGRGRNGGVALLRWSLLGGSGRHRDQSERGDQGREGTHGVAAVRSIVHLAANGRRVGFSSVGKSAGTGIVTLPVAAHSTPRRNVVMKPTPSNE